jgi:hypothetical protein
MKVAHGALTARDGRQLVRGRIKTVQSKDPDQSAELFGRLFNVTPSQYRSSAFDCQRVLDRRAVNQAALEANDIGIVQLVI